MVQLNSLPNANLSQDAFEIVTKTLRKELGESLRMFRKMKGCNQKEIALLMNIDRSTISKIENGIFAISIDYLEKFSRILDFEVKLINKENH